MFSNFEPNKSSLLARNAMGKRVLRQNLIAGNIANIDTPFYKARDIDFESSLKEKRDEVYHENKKEAKFVLAKTNDKHFDMLDYPQISGPSIFLRDGHMQRNDANTVDLDIETSELSKNAILLKSLDSANSKLNTIFKTVIDSSGRLS